MAGLLIVDDQDIVRLGMKKMIIEMEVDFGSIYEAGNGIEALELVFSKKPDIILVDILMPKLNGLQFIEELKKENINSRLIIISAHNNFKFTKEAIKYKVDDYILKPVSKKELYKVLMSAKNGIQKDMEEFKKVRDKEYHYFYMLLYEYLVGRDVLINVEKLIENFKIDFISFQFRIAIISFNCVENSKQLNFKQNIDKELKDEGLVFISLDNENGKLVYIADVYGQDDKRFESVLKKQLEGYYIEPNCGISDCMAGLKCLRELYQQAENALKESIFQRVEFYAYCDIIKKKEYLLTRKDYEGFLDLFHNQSKLELDIKVNELFSSVADKNMNFSAVENALYNVVNYLYIGLKDKYPGICDILSFRNELQNSRNMFNIKLIVKKTIDNMYDYMQKFYTRDNSNHIIDYIIKYIKSSYQRDISLAQVANELSMNYSYVSKIFALKVGMSFSEYVIQIRLEKAKELLIDGNDKIYEVAEKSGYINPRYFCMIFKKHFGLSPAEYREKYFICGSINR